MVCVNVGVFCVFLVVFWLSSFRRRFFSFFDLLTDFFSVLNLCIIINICILKGFLVTFDTLGPTQRRPLREVFKPY